MAANAVLIGIDPGPETSGVVVYRAGGSPKVIEAHAKLDLEGVRMVLHGYPAWSSVALIERVSAGAVSGKHILQTAEVVGRLMEYFETRNFTYHTLYRREVLKALGVGSGASKDALVRQVDGASDGGAQGGDRLLGRGFAPVLADAAAAQRQDRDLAQPAEAAASHGGLSRGRRTASWSP